ncbi:putative efflux protein, MATE family [Hathewaya proteolytica DSM 3090]|uniref:Probable multidrug resistance protein NorM n=1 Tax=Hathewaya proteolytica DSM 3090 TaxID=1121331 RepID=A0A1M6K3H5_9CLOT|nr:MATE family efflux transporter [Hathewaya proteolytica]SHJ53432.1 putative efflux protein, MATE family [Hathewaya proteolytica DSM 3090]
MKSEIFTNKELKKLIIPLLIEQVLAISVGIADTMMVSSAGEAAVSGVSLVDMVVVVIINVFAALATGGAVISSQLIGKKDEKGACESASQLATITVIISMAITTLCLLFKRNLLNLLFGVIDNDVMDNAITYFTISALSFPFLALYNSCAALFRSMGNSKVSMIISVIMNIINIAGNAILVLGLKMGVVGVALPSLISRMVAAAVMLVLICNKKYMIHIKIKDCFHLNISMIKKILYIGIPNGIENGLFQLGRVIVVSLIATFGTVQIAANAVANNIDNLGIIPGQAMNLAMIAVIGRCVGARDYEAVKFYIKKLLKITYKLIFGLNVIMFICLPWILSVYNLSQETIKLATTLIVIHNGFAMLLWPLAFTFPNALRAANDVKFTMVVSVFSMCAFRILFSYIIGKGLGYGAIGVWISMIIDWIFRITCFAIRYKSGRWKDTSLV